MIAAMKTRTYNDEQINRKFLELLPGIRKIAHMAFRDYDPDRQDDAVQEVIAAAFVNVKRLASLGRLGEAKVTPITIFAIKLYRSGRRTGCRQNSKDVMGDHCRSIGRSRIKNFGLAERITDTWQTEAVAINARYPVPQQVAFKMDFGTWFRGLEKRDREIIKALGMGDSTSEVAKKFNVSWGRISQLRRKYAESWFAYIQGTEVESETAEVA
jgi:hypothetical protein